MAGVRDRDRPIRRHGYSARAVPAAVGRRNCPYQPRRGVVKQHPVIPGVGDHQHAVGGPGHRLRLVEVFGHRVLEDLAIAPEEHDPAEADIGHGDRPIGSHGDPARLDQPTAVALCDTLGKAAHARCDDRYAQLMHFGQCVAEGLGDDGQQGRDMGSDGDQQIIKASDLAEKSPEDIISGLNEAGSKFVKDKDPDDDVTFVVIKVK